MEKKAAEVAFVVEEVTEPFDRLTIEDKTTSSESTSPISKPAPPRDTGAIPSQNGEDTRDVLRRIRAVRKKMKQIEELEARIASGDIQKPDRDQMNKIARKEEFREELQELLEIQKEESTSTWY